MSLLTILRTAGVVWMTLDNDEGDVNDDDDDDDVMVVD